MMKGLALVVFALSPTFASAAEALNVRFSEQSNGTRMAFGVTYAKIDNETLKLDLAVPKGKGPFPTVICFHGGSWRFGSRADMGSFVRKLAENGYAAASVSYRFMPKNKFPAQIEDAKTSVRFLREHAKDFDLDPEKFAALGLSSGGHLALLLGMTDSSAGFDGKLYPDVSSKVQCVVDFFGPTDMSLYALSEGLMKSFIVPFLGAKCLTDASVFRKASPIEYVNKNAPPTLVIHGNIDVIVPIIHSERLIEKMKKAGTQVEMMVVNGAGHGWYEESTRKETALATLKFLDKQFKGGK